MHHVFSGEKCKSRQKKKKVAIGLLYLLKKYIIGLYTKTLKVRIPGRGLRRLWGGVMGDLTLFLSVFPNTL